MNAIEIRILAGLVGPCPACGSGTLDPVFDGEHFNFRCPACTASWHPERGWVHQVDVSTCPGCRLQRVCKSTAPPAVA